MTKNNKMKRKFKTQTYGYQDNPSYSIYPGHVSAKEFSAGFRREGWEDSDLPEVSHKWIIKTRRNRLKFVPEGTKGARRYTVMEW